MINIPARRRTNWQHVLNTNINQSYFFIVRATHNSNSLAQSVVPPFMCVLFPGFHTAIISSWSIYSLAPWTKQNGD